MKLEKVILGYASFLFLMILMESCLGSPTTEKQPIFTEFRKGVYIIEKNDSFLFLFQKSCKGNRINGSEISEGLKIKNDSVTFPISFNSFREEEVQVVTTNSLFKVSITPYGYLLSNLTQRIKITSIEQEHAPNWATKINYVYKDNPRIDSLVIVNGKLALIYYKKEYMDRLKLTTSQLSTSFQICDEERDLMFYLYRNINPHTTYDTHKNKYTWCESIDKDSVFIETDWPNDKKYENNTPKLNQDKLLSLLSILIHSGKDNCCCN